MSNLLWDFVNSIHHNKNDLLRDDCDNVLENQYNSFLVNRALSFSPDTILYANEMNQRQFLDSKLQYHYLLNTIRSKKRFNKWLKTGNTEKLDIISQFYGYNLEKAKEVESIFSDNDIEMIKSQLFTGGVKENK